MSGSSCALGSMRETNARNARNGVRQRDSVEIIRLKEELAVAHALARSLETEYSIKISDLEAFRETAKRSELVEREQLEMLVQSAQAEAADLRVTVERNEKLIAELELGVGQHERSLFSSTVPVSIEVLEQKLAQTTQLLESTIMLLSQATEDSRKASTGSSTGACRQPGSRLSHCRRSARPAPYPREPG